MKGREVNRSGLAETLGVSLPTVDNWVRAGCPVVQRGGRGIEWVFNTADVAKWLRDRAVKDATGDEQEDEKEIERRTKRARMLQAELELAKAAGEVSYVADFERAQAARWALVRQNVMNVVQRALLQLIGCTDEAEFKAKLRAELTLALDTAAKAEISLEDDDEVSGA